MTFKLVTQRWLQDFFAIPNIDMKSGDFSFWLFVILYDNKFETTKLTWLAASVDQYERKTRRVAYSGVTGAWGWKIDLLKQATVNFNKDQAWTVLRLATED